MVTKEEYAALREGAARRIFEKTEEIADIVKGLREKIGGEALEANDVSIMIDLETGQQSVSAYKYVEGGSPHILDASVINGTFYPDGLRTAKFIGEEA